MTSGKIDELFNQSVILFEFLTRLLVSKCTRNRPLILLSKHCNWVKMWNLQGSQLKTVFERSNTSSVVIAIQNNS